MLSGCFVDVDQGKLLTMAVLFLGFGLLCFASCRDP